MDIDVIPAALKKIKVVYQDYLLSVPSGFDNHASMYWLQRSIEQYTGYKISVKKVAWNHVQIKGRLDRYITADGVKTADIIVCANLNNCWFRFVALKEMCHLVIDECDRSINGTSTVNTAQSARNLISELIALARPPQMSDAVVSEYLAVYCAIEILFPVKRRQAIMALNASGNIQSNLAIATSYQLPEYYVEQTMQPFVTNVLATMALEMENEVFSS